MAGFSFKEKLAGAFIAASGFGLAASLGYGIYATDGDGRAAVKKCIFEEQACTTEEMDRARATQTAEKTQLYAAAGSMALMPVAGILTMTGEQPKPANTQPVSMKAYRRSKKLSQKKTKLK